MKSSVRPELPTVMDCSALLSTRPDSTYKSGKVVQTNGTTSRERLASMLIMTLALDLPLRKPALEYLRWMLIELREKDAIPNVASRGNAVKTREYVAQIRRLVEVLHSIPKGTVIQRLEGAAKVMNCSYQKVRGMYYSDTFRAYDAISKKSSPH